MCFRSVFFSVLIGSAILLAADERPLPRIAVCPFDDRSVPAGELSPGWQRLFALLVERALEASGTLEIVDRTRVQEAFDSLKLAAYGLIQADQAGKLLGARYMVLGDFMTQGADYFIVNIRLLDMANGELVPKFGKNMMASFGDLSPFFDTWALELAGSIGGKVDRRAEKAIVTSGSYNRQALTNLARALAFRDRREYQSALECLNEAARADSQWAEIRVQRKQVTDLLNLQEQLKGPNSK